MSIDGVSVAVSALSALIALALWWGGRRAERRSRDYAEVVAVGFVALSALFLFIGVYGPISG